MRGVTVVTKIFQNAWLVSVAERISSIAAKFAIYIVIARVLGAEAQGVYGLFNSFFSIAAVIIIAGIDIANTYFIAKNPTKENISVYLSNSLVLWVIGTIAGVLIFPLLYHFKVVNFPNAEIFILSAIAFSLTLLRQCVRGVIYGRGMFAAQFWGVFILDVVSFPVILLLLALDKLSISFFIQLQLVLTAASIIYWFWVASRDVTIRLKFYKEPFVNTLKYGSKAYVSNIIQGLNLRINFFFISHYLGFTALGYYTIAVTISEVVYNLPLSVTNVILQKQSGKSSTDNTLFPVLNFLVIAGILATAIAATFFVPVIFGSEFQQSIKPLYILLAGTFFLSLGSIVSYILMSKDKGQYTIIASASALIVTIITSALFIPQFGLEGAAASTFAAYIVYAFILYYFLQRETGDTMLYKQMIPSFNKSLQLANKLMR